MGLKFGGVWLHQKFDVGVKSGVGQKFAGFKSLIWFKILNFPRSKL